MPLKRGTSDETRDQNIRELIRDWERDGTIGNSRPKTKKQAIEQATAIAYRIQREERAKRRKRSRKRGS